MFFFPREILKLLPKKSYWKSDEVAKAFGVHVDAIRKAAKKNNIGKIYGKARRGTRIYIESDIHALCEVIQGPGSQGNYSRERAEHVKKLRSQSRKK